MKKQIIINKRFSNEIIWEVEDPKTGKSASLSYNHSDHSLNRARQRGISNSSIKEVIDYGKAYFKQGLIFYVLGNNKVKSKRKANKTSNMVVVIAGDSDTIITCYRSEKPFKHIKKKKKRLSSDYSLVA